MESAEAVRAVAGNSKEYSILISELNSTLQVDRAMRTALSSVLAVQKRRIFQDGAAANNTKIGKYSTKPISISRKNQARYTGKTKFEGGYAEYKSLIGRNPGYVTLRNTDQMMLDYNLFVLGNNEYGLGFANDLNFDKSGWQEIKWDKDIFDESEKEGELVENILYVELDRTIK